jgi:hypothetical protein
MGYEKTHTTEITQLPSQETNILKSSATKVKKQ